MKPAVHQYEDKLLDLAYGELPAAEATAVEAHVQECAKCAQALSELRGVRVSMGHLPQLDAPEAGLDSLLAYAEQAARRNAAGPVGAPSFWKKLVAPLAGVAALGVVAVVGWQSQEELQHEFSPEQVAREATAAAPVAVAPAAAPVDRAPAEEQQQAGGEKIAVQQAYGATGLAEERQRELAGNLAAADKLSQTRRAAPTKSKSIAKNELEEGFGGVAAGKLEAKKDAKAARDDFAGASPDYSNAAQRGAAPSKPVAAAAPSAEPAPAPSAPSKKGSLALGGGYGLSSGQGGAGRSAPSDFDEAETVSDSAAVDQKAAPLAKAPGSKSAGPARAQATGDAREGAVDAAQALSQARAARNSGNRQQEIAFAERALAAGAAGAQRAEALQRLCEAYDALGLEGQADPYCGALAREFPTSAGARAVAQRRNQPSLSPKPAAKRKSAERRLEADEVQKAAEPAQSAPAQAD